MSSGARLTLEEFLALPETKPGSEYVDMRERLRDTRGDEPFFGAPDFAVEIMSPDDRMSDVLDRVRFYLENGVRLVWLIDPATRTVMVWSTWGTARVLTEAVIADGGDVLPGFSTPVRDILPSRDIVGA